MKRIVVYAAVDAATVSCAQPVKSTRAYKEKEIATARVASVSQTANFM